MNRFITLVIIGVSVSLGAIPPVRGEANIVATQSTEFRVTTKIFSGKKDEVSAEHLVLFSKSLVYDLPQVNDSVVTVFDAGRGRVILLDRTTQVRTTIATDDLVKLTAQLRAAATDKKSQDRLGLNATIDPIVVDPKTDQAAAIDLNDGDADIASDGFMTSYGDVRYEVLTQTPRQASISAQYGQFADWALRLNVARRMGSPPFARMSLNDRITAAGQLPRETKLTIRRGFTSDRYRSTHDLIERLSDSDRKQISDILGMLALYKEVPLEQFPH